MTLTLINPVSYTHLRAHEMIPGGWNPVGTQVED